VVRYDARMLNFNFLIHTVWTLRAVIGQSVSRWVTGSEF
jgi:hypothetical protein